MKKTRNDESPASGRVHIRCSINGEPARILVELKRRGLVRSHVDALCQGLLCFWNKVVEMQLKEAQLKASMRLQQEGE